MISVFLLAENRLLREALFRMLAKKEGLNVLGAAAFTAQVVQDICNVRPDVLLADPHILSVPEFRIPAELCKAVPGLKVVMIGMEDDKETFLRSVRDGVAGYLLKEASALEVLAAIRSVVNGEAVCPPALCMTLFRYVSAQHAHMAVAQIRRNFPLTRREQQLLPMISRGLTNKEIAGQLNLSDQTVKNHVHRILRKLGAADRMTAMELYRLQNVVA